MGLFRDECDDVDVATCLANLERLVALDRSGLMDAPRSERLDGLTRRAADELRTPMAFMSLLDDRRIFLASAVGIAEELADRREDTAESSYCQYVVALDDVLIINDSLEDNLVRHHPATAGGVRAYLGVPLRRDGHCLGSFCVVDDRAREWTHTDVEVLKALAESALPTS